MSTRRDICVRSFALCAAVSVGPLATFAQNAPQGASDIDNQLLAGVDLRLPAYGVCLAQTSCAVGGLEIAGMRKDVSQNWQPAPLYWDPVDGFGVQGSGQNDEIDFDERIVVTFASPRVLTGVWLSDLFVGEGARYGGMTSATEDAELGQVLLSADGAIPISINVSGDVQLPDVTFNSRIYAGFEKEGDLLSRLIVDDEEVRIFAAGMRQGAPLVSSAGEIDPDVAAIFESIDSVERDDAALLSLVSGVVLFPFGSRNAEILTALADDPGLYSSIYQQAVLERSFGDRTNGEVGSTFGESLVVSSVTFSAAVGTSNDFSVAGFMVN